MAQTPAEIQKAYRERKKASEQAAGDATYPFLKEPFYLWLERTDGGGDWTAAECELNLASIEMPQFEDDGGPRPNDDAFGDDLEEHYRGYEKSVGRAEAMVDNLIGAYSGATRPLIPETSGHLFRFYPATDSGASGHPVM